MKTGARLAVILTLLASTAAVMYWAPPVKSATNPVSVYAVPATVGAWTGVDGVPEGILPLDPHERATVRRTYRNGEHIAWVSVAMFVDQDSEKIEARGLTPS